MGNLNAAICISINQFHSSIGKSILGAKGYVRITDIQIKKL